ncbi:MAG: hypothetical protein GY916_06885 [Gammaproteobacteria bacterium]|nr:hypothetical protein [Gammaproteobacteria bacterium]
MRNVKTSGVLFLSTTPGGFEGQVYDLSVDTTHTYFANSMLAHNKLS